MREAVQRAAAQLNRLDWRELTNATDDFVVFAADGMHEFNNDYEEMTASVPAERIAQFRSGKLLGTDPWHRL